MNILVRAVTILRIFLGRIGDRLRSMYWKKEIERMGAKVEGPILIKSGAKFCFEKGAKAVIGRGFAMAENSRIYVAKKASFCAGEGVFIGCNSVLSARASISIGAGSQIAHNVTIIDHDHDIASLHNGDVGKAGNAMAIRVGNNVWIGANAVLLKGVDLADGTVAAAGAVVTKSVPSGTMAMGAEAKPRPLSHA